MHAAGWSADEMPCGAVLGERYELRSLLGTGGAGAVYLAHDPVLERDVAIKVLRPGQDELADARLRAEARIAGSLSHPGIASLLDVGEEQTTAGAMPYLVMEHIDGRTLREVLRSGDRLSVDTVLRLMGQIAEALAVVHDAGIVHRDLKPGNIMIARDGRAVLLDFGIARHHDEEPLTVTGTIVGTVDYISPEQAAGSSATPASDLYALGMVAYECLTGLRPLRRDTQVATLMAHASITVPPLPPNQPVGVRDLIATLVALDPAHRPPSAYAVAQRVRALLEDPHRSAAHATGAGPGIAGPGMAAGRVDGLPPERRTRRRHLLAAACAVVLAAVTGGVLLGRTAPPEAVAADEAPAAVPTVTSSTAPGSRAARTPAVVAERPVAVRTTTVVQRAKPHRTPQRVTPARAKAHGPSSGHGKGHGKGHATHKPKHAAHGPGHGHGPGKSPGKGAGHGQGHGNGHGKH